jgi:hypothetical protein
VLANKMEELVALGMPHAHDADGALHETPTAETTHRDIADSERESGTSERTRPATRLRPDDRASSASTAREASAGSVPRTSTSESRREDADERRPKPAVAQPRIYVPPHAPDDPGTETADQEEVAQPLRPQRA